MGADVIKINSSERAVTTQDPHHPYYLMWNRNKRALALKMSDDSAKALARRLADEADIVIDNFSVGVLDRWGIGYNEVSQTNPGVIYVQMSGMGDGGPWSKYVTYAPTIHALCGITATTGVPGREDIGIGFSYNDHQAGLHGAVAVLAALQARRTTGSGQRVDISQFEVGINFIGPSLLDLAANGTKARPVGNDLPYDAVAPHGCYRCADQTKETGADEATARQVSERWIAIACMNESQWQALYQLMGQPDWAAQDIFATQAARYEHRELLNEHLSAWTRNADALTLMQQCQQAGVPAGVVQDGADLVEHDPQLRQRGFLQPMDDEHPTLGPTWIDRLVIQFDTTPCDDYQRTRAVGEDSAAILKDWLGMDEATLAELNNAGVLS
jgi:benzylsuccinate CoA-transferase BbsF subunit